MRKIILYIAVSLDGYIAKLNGDVSWLSKYEAKDDYNNFIKTVDTLIMGRKTYMQVKNELSSNKWFYEGLKCYVATNSQLPEDENVQFVSGEKLYSLKAKEEQTEKNIWLVGGASLASEFICRNLIDEYHITFIPVLLGSGIKLWSENLEVPLEIFETQLKGDVVKVKCFPKL